MKYVSLLGNSNSLVDYVGHVDGNDAFGARFDRKHREYAGTAADVQHDLVSKAARIVYDRVHVALSTHCVLEHFQMNRIVRVRVDVDRIVRVAFTLATAIVVVCRCLLFRI